MAPKTDYRAYINPQPAMSENAQRAVIEPFQPSAVYVQSRNEDRDDLIQSLRKGSVVLVADLYLLARATGRKHRRVEDLRDVWDEIHEAGAYIYDAGNKQRSDDKRRRKAMREDAAKKLGNAVKRGRVGKIGHEYAPEEWRIMREAAVDKRLKNWDERRAAMRRRGIDKPPKRSWFYQHVVSKLDD